MDIRRREWEEAAKRALSTKNTLPALLEVAASAADMGAEESLLAASLRAKIAAAEEWDRRASAFLQRVAPGPAALADGQRPEISELAELAGSGQDTGVRLERLASLQVALGAATRWLGRARACLPAAPEEEGAEAEGQQQQQQEEEEAGVAASPAAEEMDAEEGAASPEGADADAAAAASALPSPASGGAAAGSGDGAHAPAAESMEVDGDAAPAGAAAAGEEEEGGAAPGETAADSLPAAPAQRRKSGAAEHEAPQTQQSAEEEGEAPAAPSAVPSSAVPSSAVPSAVPVPPYEDLEALLAEYDSALIVRADEASGLRALKTAADAWLAEAAPVLEQDFVVDEQLPLLAALIAGGEGTGVAMEQLEILKANVEVGGWVAGDGCLLGELGAVWWSGERWGQRGLEGVD